MTTNTPNEGFVEPLQTDFADVQGIYDFAAQVDTRLHAYSSTFGAADSPLAFVARSSADTGAIGSSVVQPNFDVTEFDSTNNGGIFFTWVQPLADPPSWWMFGFHVIGKTVSGTPAVTDHVWGQITVSSADPVSGDYSLVNLTSNNIDTNTGGEHIVVLGMASCYHASVSCYYHTQRTSGATSSCAAGSRFWGLRLGPVSV
jgi:hypothetical protein